MHAALEKSNTGGTSISMFKRLPIGPELERVLNEQQTPDI